MTWETQIKKEIKQYISSIGGFWSMIAGGAYSKKGDPDMICCVKGKFFAIEAKTPTGVQSDWQKLRQREIEKAGGVYILARSLNDVKEIIGKELECDKI